MIQINERMRGRSKKNELTPRTLSKKETLEQNNRKLLLQIQDLEKNLQEKQKLNKKLEIKKQAKEEESKNPEEIKKSLEEQIAIENQTILEYSEKQKNYQNEIQQIEAEIANYEKERQNLMEKFQSFKDIRDSVDSAEKKLQTQKRRQSQFLENLVSLKNDISVLEGIERTTQNESMIAEIEDLNAETEHNQRQLERVMKEIKSIEQRNMIFQEVYDKWKNKLDSIEEPAASLDELANIYMQPKTKQMSPQKKRKFYQLQELIENNEAMKIAIQKERKANFKRLKQISQVKNEMKTHTNKAMDKIAKEEQRTVRRLITLQEKE